jgi:hypothetical protein
MGRRKLLGAGFVAAYYDLRVTRISVHELPTQNMATGIADWLRGVRNHD